MKKCARLIPIMFCLVCTGCWTINTQRYFWDASFRERANAPESELVPVPDIYFFGGTINMFPGMIRAQHNAEATSWLARVGTWTWFSILGVPAHLAADALLLPLTIAQQNWVVGRKARAQKPETPSFSCPAKVEWVDAERLVLSTPTDAHPFKPGMTINLLRGDKVIGIFRILKVQGKLIVGDFTGKPGHSALRNGEQLRSPPSDSP